MENENKKSSKKKLRKEGSRKILHSVDKVLNSPCGSRALLDTDLSDMESVTPQSSIPRKKLKVKQIQEKVKEAGTKAIETGTKFKRTLSGSLKGSLEEKKVSPQEESLESKNGSAGSGSLLKKGIKFSSQDAFLRYINMPMKSKHRKRKFKEIDPPPFEGAENPAFNTSVRAEESSVFNASVREEESSPPPVPPPRKKKKMCRVDSTTGEMGNDAKNNTESAENNTESAENNTKSGENNTKSGENNTKSSLNNEQLKIGDSSVGNGSSAESSTIDGVHHRFNKEKLKEILDAQEARDRPAVEGGKKSLMEKAKDKLQASRFRFLNEQLYTQSSTESVKMFKNDASLFTAYHQGFQQQAGSWPCDPLDTIIAACLHLPDSAVIADMGCGEARLARSLNNKVHCFDLVALVPGVVECDMSKVPLKSASVDVVVFCLSLMGTNIKDFLYEAARILKVDGVLKIAELESRFQGQEQSFIRDLEKFGFKLTWKDFNKQFFVFFDLKKVKDPKTKKKLPIIELKPCVYKKR